MEDNEINQEVSLALLGEMGVKTDLAQDGKEVIKLTEETVYDVILMDIQMPEMDGFETTKYIRNYVDKNKQTPIIAMSAHALSDIKEKAIEAGMNDYITKPIDMNVLQEKIENILTHTSSEIPIPETTLIFNKEAFLHGYYEKDVALKILTAFLQRFPRDLEKLHDLVNTEDWDALRHHTHTMKGATSNLGVEKLNLCSAFMEDAAKEHNSDRIKAESQRIDSLYAEAKKAIEEAISSNYFGQS